MHMSSRTTTEGYILRYQTDDRNLSFKFKSAPEVMGEAIRDHVNTGTTIESKSLRAFFIKSGNVAGEFEGLERKNIEILMNNSCHLFFIEMWNRECLDTKEVEFNEECDVIGILNQMDKKTSALERLVYFPFKERSVKNLYILVYSTIRKSIINNYNLKDLLNKNTNNPDDLEKELYSQFCHNSKDIDLKKAPFYILNEGNK